MTRFLPLLLLFSGCAFFDLDTNEKPLDETTTDIKTEPEDKTKNPIDEVTKPTPENYAEFAFERSEAPRAMASGNWAIRDEVLKATIDANLLLGFPDVVGNLDNIGDWLLGLQDPCINVLDYEITSVAARGSVAVAQISQEDIPSDDNDGPTNADDEPSTTLYRVSPKGEGEGFVVILADYTGWKSWGGPKPPKEGCEDPAYPQKLELTINLNVQQPDGATIELPEMCSLTPTFSEQTILPFSSFPTKDGERIDALNWTDLPSFEVHHSNMSLNGENVSVEFPSFSKMEPGEIKIITEFGDEKIIRVAPFSETKSYELIGVQGVLSKAGTHKVDLDLVDSLDRYIDVDGVLRFGDMPLALETAEFLTPHCTIQTPTIIESKTPEVCSIIDEIGTISSYDTELNGRTVSHIAGYIDFTDQIGDCVIEASTTTEVTHEFRIRVESPN